MAKTDRTILISNDQQFGQIADPNKLEAQITHAFDKIDENDNELIAHRKQVDPTSSDTTRDKHVSNNDLKGLQDQITTNLDNLTTHKKQVDPTSSDTTRDKHVANNDLKTLQDQITTNDTASVNRDNTHKTASVLDHPDQSVTTEKIKDLAVTSNKIANGAVSRNQLDPTLFEQTANASKFQEIDAQLAEIVENDRYISIKKHGALGNGNDDTQAIIDTIDDCLSSGKILYVPTGGFEFTTPLIYSNFPDIVCDGYLSYSGIETDGVLILGSDTLGTSEKDLILRIRAKTKFTNPLNRGVVLKNINHSKIHLKAISLFGKGIMLHGNNSIGFCYNEILLGYFYHNDTNLVLQSDNNGWVNENLFSNGSFQYKSGVDYSQSIGILLSSDNYRSNNNTFNKPSFENIGTGVKVDKGRLNEFKDMRCENVNVACVDNDGGGNVFHIGNGTAKSSVIPPSIVTSRTLQSIPFAVQIFRKDFSKGVTVDTNVNTIGLDTMCFVNSGGGTTTLENYGETNYTYDGKSITQIALKKGVGVFIDTRECKKLSMRKTSENGLPGRWFFRCYDSAGTVIPNTNNSVKAVETVLPYSEINNIYRSTVSNDYDQAINVASNVSFLLIGFMPISNNVSISDIVVYGEKATKTANSLSNIMA